MAKRLFTPGEANSALAEVRPVAERLVATRARMRGLVETQGDLVTAIGGNGGGYAASDLNAAHAELAQLAERVADCVRELDALGVVVKDLDTGLLDFPALRDGEEVELCWHVGEERVEYWHEIGIGFRGRKPIDWGE
ncbi:MAG TPA: DUF2203 domain-containing protein [Gaiellaceae bacterium]|nr:DUF2203 domain-containing protein [Gaiellaceae bacterium]